MLRRTIPSIFIIMALVFLFSCSGSADKPDVAVESISLDSTELTLKAGETATLEAAVSPEDATDKTLLWESDSDAIAVEDGVITVSGTAQAGEYTITVTSVSDPDVKAICTITVEAASAGGGGGGGGSSSGGEEVPSEPDETIDLDNELSENSGESGQTAVTEPIAIGNDVSVIKLTNLESGKMYTLYPERKSDVAAAKSLPAAPRSTRASRSSSNLNSLSGGNYIFTVPEGQSDFTFAVDDINLVAGDAFRVGKVATTEIEFTEADTKGIIIQQDKDKPIFTRQIGDITHQIFEKFFAVDMSEVQDKEHIAFLNVLSGKGTAHASTNFGIIDAYGNDLIGDKQGALLDFRNESTIYVYMYMEVTSADTHFALTLHLTNPETIDTKPINLTAPNIYMFEPSREKRIVEIEFPQDLYFGSSGFNNDVGARYASTGERHPYFYPIKIEGNKLLMNLEPNIAGYENEPIIFDLEYAPSGVTIEASVRNRETEDTEAEPITVEAAKENKISVTIPADSEIYPMVFKLTDGTPIKSAKINVEGFKEEELIIVASHSYKQGFSQQIIPSYDDITDDGRVEVQFSEDEYLEYAIYSRSLSDLTEKSVSFTITI